MHTRRPVLFVLLFALLTAAPSWAGKRSEDAAAELLDRRMKNQRPEDHAILQAVKGKHIVVVRGSMDHIEQVLDAARIRHTLIAPNQVAMADLTADQILMVNCPGNIPAAGVRRIAKFVRAGGLLYTTDWALLNVVQKAFPGTIQHNGKSTGDHVTKVHVHKHKGGKAHDNVMSNMLLTSKTEPQWWLEGGSYPIQILDKKRVKVLASSPQMGKQYGAAPVVVRFRWEDGEVIHVVSHFYRQIATQGAAVASKDAIDGVSGLTAADKKAYKASGGAGVPMTEVESSYAFQQMTSNVVVGKQRRNRTLDKSYRWKSNKTVDIDGRQAPAGSRLKELERKGKKVKVRDDRGNETWLDEDDLESR